MHTQEIVKKHMVRHHYRQGGNNRIMIWCEKALDKLNEPDWWETPNYKTPSIKTKLK